jgi:hypothetical protein
VPKKVPTEELDAIAAFIAGHPGGVRVGAIREGLESTLQPRMLQRRLQRLVEEGRIMTKGSGKGQRYFPTRASLTTNRTNAVDEEGEIPLSASAQEIRKIVQPPLSARTPVGYRTVFLDAYIPNQSAYLSSELRGKLAAMGQVGVSDLPAGTYIRQIMHRLLIDLSWNSSRLEGNTYSLLETQRLLELGESAGGRAAEDTQMILNHKAAIEMLADQAEEIGFNRYTVCNLHALLSDNLLGDPAACGRLRSRAVGIGGSVYYPLEVPQQIEECFLEILEKAEAISDPFEQSFFIMVQLPYLQPFEDVNKRVSRLAANIPFVRQNLCPLSFIDVPQAEYVSGLLGIYELNKVDYLRDVFVWAYQRSSARYSAVMQSLGDPDPFRLRYRDKIGEFVRDVVTGGMNKTIATNAIAKRAEGEITQADRAKFIEVVETELSSLHEGNIARYRLRPGEFARWKQNWR